jgi:hypothetical protein
MPFPKTREEEHRDNMSDLHDEGRCPGDRSCWVCEENDSNPIYTGEQARELLNEAVMIIRKVRYNRIGNHINSSPLEHAISDINAAILDLEEYR